MLFSFRVSLQWVEDAWPKEVMPWVGLYIRARSGSFLPRSDCLKPAPHEQGADLGVGAGTCTPSTQEVAMGGWTVKANLDYITRLRCSLGYTGLSGNQSQQNRAGSWLFTSILVLDLTQSRIRMREEDHFQ